MARPNADIVFQNRRELLKLLDLSLPSPVENLALDEALLDEREAASSAETGYEVLRFWQTPSPFVALGYVCHREAEVHLDECVRRNIPVLRRATGGGTVLQASGVLNYALILKIEHGTPTENLTTTNRFVMNRMREALQTLLPDEVSVRGITDLSLGDRKFCGNAQRRRKNFLLFHGAFLLDCDLDLMSAVLKPPPRQPDYREGRTHKDFVTNLHLPPLAVKDAIANAWQVDGELTAWPRALVEKLVAEKYGRDDWNQKF